MVENITSNPFVGCTARDMKFEEVRQYWCSPFALYSLNEGELLTSRTPIVIEGARGSGKTMILKYLSYSVQKDLIKEEPITKKLEYFQKSCIGIYFRYKEDFCNMFNELECDIQDKEKIFKHYYELFISRQILEVLEDIYYEENSASIEVALCLFFRIKIRPLKEVRTYINTLLKQMDEIVNASGYDELWREKMMPLIGFGNMVVEIIRTINNSIQGWKDILFVILLDEYENLGMFQTMVNTLIKQVDDTANLTYRLGMRPAGMDDNNRTNIASERLQVDRDFLLRRLDYKNFKEYKQFALDISTKRLESINFYKEKGLIDINAILGKNENFDSEAALVVKGKKHFKLLKNMFTDKTLTDVINELSCEEKLMEMYNIIRVYRGEDYKRTGELCRQYQELRNIRKLSIATEELYKYHLDYSNKYRVTLLYILLTIYSERKLYYSVNTFLRLSSGSINDFISLCRNVFKHMNNAMLEDLINGISVSKQIQTYASVDTAEDQRRKAAMSNKYGKEMYTFIDNMGSIFEEYHRDLEAKYPETNQFAFENENQIKNTDSLNAYLVELINSGAVIRKQKRQLISVGKMRGYIYQLNRIYAPIYQYSYRTRGGYNQIINAADFQIMLEESINPQKYTGRNLKPEQYRLFDYKGDEEDGSTDL